LRSELNLRTMMVQGSQNANGDMHQEVSAFRGARQWMPVLLEAARLVSRYYLQVRLSVSQDAGRKPPHPALRRREMKAASCGRQR
jgi:hypothetical protein